MDAFRCKMSESTRWCDDGMSLTSSNRYGMVVKYFDTAEMFFVSVR